MVAYKNLFRKKVFKDSVVCNADLFVKKQFLDVWVVSRVSAISYSKQRSGGGRVGDEVKKQGKARTCTRAKCCFSQHGWEGAFTALGLFSPTPFLIRE